jgi:hypothetical protein
MRALPFPGRSFRVHAARTGRQLSRAMDGFLAAWSPVRREAVALLRLVFALALGTALAIGLLAGAVWLVMHIFR